MTSLLKSFEKLKTDLFEKYSKDAGKMLLHTGALGWAISSAAQICGIIVNDKVPKKEKKFLIPQEMADAVVNILAFYLVTGSIQNFTKKLASSGKLITPEIKAFCEKRINFGKWSNNIGKDIAKVINDYKAAIDILKKEKINIKNEEIKKLNDKINKYEKFQDDVYEPFESGAKVVGSVIGSILSCNIITPLLRNPIAAAKQKNSLTKDKMQNNIIQPTAPVLPAQNRFGIDDYKNQVVTSSRITSNSSMRV